MKTEFQDFPSHPFSEALGDDLVSSLSRYRSLSASARGHLLLNQVKGIGPATAIKTAQTLSCKLGEIYLQAKTKLAKIGWSESQIDSLSEDLMFELKIENWLKQSEQHAIVCFDDPAYPELLRQIAQPPLALFCNGNIDLLQTSCLAVVGSRRMSREAQLNTNTVVGGLCEVSTLTIVSGLAVGVDTIAHQSALEKNANTIAVLGCGIDVVYPLRNKGLYKQISQYGLIISEILPSVRARPEFFPKRNRIISGLSLGTLITEAQIRSGSLVTANYAAEQNREVFAIPGNIRNPNVQGCHYLLKQGAALCDSAQSIIDVIGDDFCKLPENKSVDVNEKKSNQHLASDRLLDSVDYESTPVDLIAQRAGMLISDVLVQLLEYELRGLVASTSEGYVKLGG